MLIDMAGILFLFLRSQTVIAGMWREARGAQTRVLGEFSQDVAACMDIRGGRKEEYARERLEKEFRALGKQLIAAGIYTGLDADTLGRYLVAHQEWLRADTVRPRPVWRRGDLEETEAWGRVQDRYFKQARNCANDLGLTVTSRCRLVIPEGAKQQTEDSNPFLQLIEGGRAGNG